MTGLFLEVAMAIFNAVTTFLTADYFYSLFSQKNGRHNKACAIAFAAFIASPLLLKMTVGNMIILAVCMFVVSMNFEFKLYNKFLFSIVFIAVNHLVEVSVILLISLMSGTQTQIAMSGFYLALGAILCKVLCFILCFIIGIIKKEVLVGKFSFKWISLYTLPVATSLVTFAIYRSSYYFKDDSFIQKLSFSGLFLLIISNLLIVKLVNNIRESAINEQRLKSAEELVKQQEKQYSLILENNTRIAKQRHDYKNFIIGILSELKSEEYENIRKRLENELKILNAASSDISGNIIFDTLINYKNTEAANLGITIDLDYRHLSDIKISGIDLSILLGNAIDNAVDACAKLKDSNKKKIRVIVVVQGEMIIITVENNLEEDIDIHNLKSTKKDSQFHGFGIMNMRSIAAKYNGEVVFECADRVFKTIIILDNAAKSKC